ncbi:hypothetical protein I316_07303 [Kwoniella heveanensis BCC8398]|uniref:Uncharacterized protein n=1 Tax=Kwoniella heveanensis BCC8398 TaxID=1296120 RepID=A0A1B9GIX2_9TREE|nr:hypothetical protein I316_07303 [Kwoniella heveanensis BCC8398]
MDLGAPLNERTKAVPPSPSSGFSHTTTSASTSTLVDRDTIAGVPPAHIHKDIDGTHTHPHGVPPSAEPVPVPTGVMDGPGPGSQAPPEPVPPAVGGAGPQVPSQQTFAAPTPAADPSLNQLPNPNSHLNTAANANGRATVDPSNTEHPVAQAVLHDNPHDTAVPSAPSTATSASDPSKGTTQPADHPSHPQAQAPTASIDPNKPSSESAPTALPTNPATHPEEQKRALQDEHPAVIGREVEKTKAEARELKGEPPKGTVVHGLEDDRLWAMLRRFDVQITHVLHPATNLPPKEPDLRPSTLPNLPSHSDVLRSNLERVFAAVGPSSVRGAREMQRLMSWSPEERWRTGTYCAAYFTCWVFGYAIAGVCSFLIALICFPECRRYLFPPVPPAPFTPPSATDPTNQKGDESLLGNVESKTVHRTKAEQAEEQAFEATSILQAYTTRLLFDGRKKGKEAGNSNVGEKKAGSSSSSSDVDDDVPPGQPAVNRTAKQGQAQGLDSGAVVVGGETITPEKPLNDKEKKKLAQREAKRKRDEMVSKMTKATEDGLGAFADTIERFTNALSPPLPYPDSYARFKIAGAFVVPIMFLFTFVPPWIFARSATFFFGVGMWGQPLLIRAAEKFVELVPNWQELLDMRNSILSQVPTDAQLTLHLLRVAEALNSPLPRPPPPPLKGTPKEAIKDTTPATVTAEDDAEVLEAEQEGGLTEAATKAKHKTKSHILGAFKAAGKKMAAFHGDVAVDGTKKQARINETDSSGQTSENEKSDLTAKEKIGSKVDKLFFKGHIKDYGGEESYPCKLDGTSGHLILENRSDIIKEPRITFVPVSGKSEHFVLPIDDIVEIKKSHVSMPRMALGWASGAEVEGLGLTVRFKPVAQQILEAQGGKKSEGKTLHFTRVGRREQLFVRLVSMGVQRWEVL